MNMRPLLAVATFLVALGVPHPLSALERPDWVEGVITRQEAVAPPADPGLARDIEKDKELGAKVHEEIKKQVKFDETEEANGRVQRIGAELAAIANQTHVTALWGDKRFVRLDYQFFVVQDKEVNAFSVPGGYIYIYTGLLDFCESDDELAGVIGHEIAHASLRHVAEMEKRQSTINLATLPIMLMAIFSNSADAGNALIGIQALGMALSSGWSVEAETASDYAGLQYIEKSNYKPAGLLTFMERLGYQDRLAPMQNLGILRTHPPTPERIAFLRRELQRNNIPIRRSEVTTSLRATIQNSDDGGLTLYFGKFPIHSFRGADAIPRADAAEEALNRFFDAEPLLMDYEMDGDGNVYGFNRRLFAVLTDDLEAQEMTLEEMRATVRDNMRRALFDFNYRVGSASPR
jgi:beta-barrel assembly-enhancing protease